MFAVCSLDGASVVNRLSEYPWVVVRLGCRYCQRQGSYRLARLSAKFGAEIGLDDLLDTQAIVGNEQKVSPGRGGGGRKRRGGNQKNEQ